MEEEQCFVKSFSNYHAFYMPLIRAFVKMNSSLNTSCAPPPPQMCLVVSHPQGHKSSLVEIYRISVNLSYEFSHMKIATAYVRVGLVCFFFFF